MGKRFSLVVVFAVTILGAARADAAADTWTSNIAIQYLDTTSPTSVGDAYAIGGPGSFTGAFSNPAGCTGDLRYAYVSTADVTTSAQKDLISRTVLAAFLAGKSIRLQMSGTRCTTGGVGGSGSPVYKAVALPVP